MLHSDTCKEKGKTGRGIVIFGKVPGTSLLRSDFSVGRHVGNTEQASIPAESKTLHWECAQESKVAIRLEKRRQEARGILGVIGEDCQIMENL